MYACLRVAGELLGRAGRDDAAPLVAALGPEVHDEVRGLDDIQVVLDDHDRIALVDELVQHLEQAPDVGEVQSGRRLVQDVEGPPRRPPLSSVASFTRWASPPDRVVAA